MKQFVIFVLLYALILQGDARKVCILFEQKNVPTDITILDNQESVKTKREISDIQEDIVITIGEHSEVTDEIASVTEQAITDGSVTEEASTDEIASVTVEAITEEVVTEKTHDVSAAISSVSDVSASKLTNVCALEGITLFDDQHVSSSYSGRLVQETSITHRRYLPCRVYRFQISVW